MTKNIKNEVLNKINKGEVKIKSKNWFHFVKVGFGCLIALLTVIAIIIANYAIYIPKRMGAFRHAGQINNSVMPWLLILIAVILIGIVVWIYKEYESGYKKNVTLILLGSVIIVLFLGFLLAFSGLNERLEHNPQMRRFHDWQEDSFGPGRMNRQNPQFR